MDLLFCPECGSNVQPTDHTCSYCGFNLDKYREESIKTPPNNPTQQKNKKNPRLAIIIFAVIIVIGLVGTLVALTIISDSDEKNTSSTSYIEPPKEQKKDSDSNTTDKTEKPDETAEPEESVPSSNPVTNQVQDDVPDTTVEPEVQKTTVQPLNFGEIVTLDFVQFSIDSSACAEEIYPTTLDNVYRYQSDQEGEKYLYLKGTIKNIGTEAFEFADSTSVSVKFDDKYTYGGYVTAEEGGSMSYIYSYLDPLQSTTFYILVSVPDEMIQTYKYAVFTFGFQDNFNDYYGEEPNHIYSVKVTR